MFWRKRTISKIALSPPAPDPARHGLGLCLIVRNEERHIAEWAEFHAMAGVRHFFVYDNGCTDATIKVLRGSLPPAQLTIIPWDQKLKDARSGAEIHNQVLAYAHCLRNFGARFRWLGFIDTDEFLVPTSAPDLPAALEPLAEHAHISLPWHMFGRGGHEEPPQGGVLENYLDRMADPHAAPVALNWKCLVDPTRVTTVRVHGFGIDGQDHGVNDAGRPAAHADRKARSFYSTAAIQLNHYYTRSNAELMAKIERGSNKTVAAERHHKRVMRIVSAIEADTLRDDSVARFRARQTPHRA